MSIKSVAVFCGSGEGNHQLFATHARQLGKSIAEKKITLIYGGGNSGLMGILANEVMANAGTVIGIIPRLLTEWERKHTKISELHEVADMHTRKRMFYEKCDAAVILPGGYGTMDEFFEILTWNQLKIHDKPIIVVNTAGFYDHLLKHLEVMKEAEFLHTPLKTEMVVVNSPAEIGFLQ